VLLNIKNHSKTPYSKLQLY